MPPRPRPYLSFPRGRKLPSPRILLYASDLPELAARDVFLAEVLQRELEGASLVIATGAESATCFPSRARFDVVKVPGLDLERVRPLEAERIRRLRQKLLRTLFDVFLPEVLLLDMVGPEAEVEARLLLARAKVFGTSTLVGVAHDEPGQGCELSSRGAEPACTRCQEKIVRSVQEALAERAGE
jgi:predicted glycosyltransferase